MKESDEIAGLASPKAVRWVCIIGLHVFVIDTYLHYRRTGDFGELLLGRASPQVSSICMKTVWYLHDIIGIVYTG